jgi:hypothetical protein
MRQVTAWNGKKRGVQVFMTRCCLIYFPALTALHATHMHCCQKLFVSISSPLYQDLAAFASGETCQTIFGVSSRRGMKEVKREVKRLPYGKLETGLSTWILRAVLEGGLKKQGVESRLGQVEISAVVSPTAGGPSPKRALHVKPGPRTRSAPSISLAPATMATPKHSRTFAVD